MQCALGYKTWKVLCLHGIRLLGRGLDRQWPAPPFFPPSSSAMPPFPPIPFPLLSSDPPPTSAHRHPHHMTVLSPTIRAAVFSWEHFGCSHQECPGCAPLASCTSPSQLESWVHGKVVSRENHTCQWQGRGTRVWEGGNSGPGPKPNGPASVPPPVHGGFPDHRKESETSQAGHKTTGCEIVTCADLNSDWTTWIVHIRRV